MAVVRGMEEIERAEDELKKLRVAYEKYFAGIERIEPLKDRDELKKSVRRLMSEQGNNTARRFRTQSLQASLVTYENHWNRVCRQIEEGTFRRDRWRAKRVVTDADASEEATELASAAPALPPVVTPSSEPGVTAPPSSYPPSLYKLRDALVSARAKVGDARPVSLDALASTVRKQVADIKGRYQCDSVEFKVAVKEGKVVLKAVPKRAEATATAARAATKPPAASGRPES